MRKIVATIISAMMLAFSSGIIVGEVVTEKATAYSTTVFPE